VSRRDLSITVFERKVEGQLRWFPLVPWAGSMVFSGKSEVRLREELTRAAREHLRTVEPEEQELWDAMPGTRLHQVHLDITVKGPSPVRVSGRFPFVVEPRWFTEQGQRLCAYHPFARGVWFDAADVAEVEELAPHFARRAWKGMAQGDLELHRHDGKERLLTISFRIQPRTLLDRIRAPRSERTLAGVGRGHTRVLSRLGVDQTSRAIDGTLPVGVPREPYRTQLQRVLGGRPRSTLLVGRPGSGRSTLLARWVSDRLEEDGWYIERNADKIHRVWRLSGKRLVAGMMYMGDWEARLLDVAEEAREHKGILWFDDLHLFGRLGVTRQSERSFADFFRGPVQRGDVTLVGAITREQLARLEDDAPSFAGLFTRLAIEPTTAPQTAKLALAEVRRLEAERPVELHPFVPRTVIELAGSLFPWTAMPGAAIELLRKLVLTGGKATLDPSDAVALAARETGLPERLIKLDEPLDPAEVEAHFAARVIGQEEATAAAAELVLRVRSGLVDAARPLGVYLFTGPTGTGKTELATAMAEYLYGDARRLLRFDMSELSGGDAVARLIGDRWDSEGMLTTRIREQPFAVVLLDEIEKAHPSVLALLLQLFDEGRLTDAAGDVASFRHAAIVMTSNLGARAASPLGFGDGTASVMGQIAKAVKEFFPPELWNRIDRVVRFKPLTAEVAAKVVDKELAKLMARRGLRERNVFVYAGRALRERAVAQAFDPRYGARTVKRWLEDQVATELAEALSVAPPARLTVARLRDEGGGVTVDLEQLPEARPLDGDFPLAAWRDLAASALVPHTEAMALEIDALADGPALAEQDARARSTPGTEVRYFLETYREEVLALRVQLAGERKSSPSKRRATPSVDESDDELTHDLETFTHDRITHANLWYGGTSQVRRFNRRSVDDRRHRALDQGAALLALARARVLVDHVGELATPERHAFTMLLSTVGSPRGAGWDAIGAAFSMAYELDELAVVDRNGKVVVGKATTEMRTPPAFVLRNLRELLIGPALGPEHGSHVFQSLAGEPEIVRVDLRPGAVDVRAAATDHRDALAAYDVAVAAGGPAPNNPEPLLPVVRAISYTPPRRVGDPVIAEVEDFVTGFVARVTAPTLYEVIRHCWHVRWSRTGGGR
jgi:ATP-dependent Clp protease ATP-binding subunit ClpC